MRLASLLLLTASLAGAQPGQSAGQSAGQRLSSLVARGDSAGARQLADSLANSSSVDSPEAAAGLYWRGLLSRSADSSRLDFSRIVLEHSMRPIAGDALYRLAMLDLAAGDRASARRRLTRASRDYGTSSTAGDAALELANLFLAEGAMHEGCAALDSALQHIPGEQVEKRNRVTYLRRPCAQVEAEVAKDTAKGAVSETKPPVPAGNRPAARGGRGSTAPVAASAARWSVQVGAFATHADAEKTSQRLIARGYESRVTGERPFRVRIGRYAKRADAVGLMTKLKGEKTTAILVEAERP